jgi:molecular chaperone GrpE
LTPKLDIRRKLAMGTRSMDTEKRKTAADEPVNDQVDDSAGVAPDESAQTGGGESVGPENAASEASAAEDSLSGWTAPVDEAAEAAASETSPESDADTIARLETEKSDLTDRLLRVVAEMDNLRKRTEREVTDARKFSLARFAGDMLSVSDNLKRALDAVPPEARDTGDEALDALLAGVEMTGREMERMLEKNGVTRIAALGERFDPHCHQAMFEVPDESIPNQTVVEVVQDGYRIGERILRAAMVGIAKGGPKAAKPEVAPEPVSEPANDDAETGQPEPPSPPDPPEAA